jgi:hypothetical protein
VALMPLGVFPLSVRACNYTVPLELTLSKIVENFQTHPAAPRPASGASNARKILIIFRGAQIFLLRNYFAGIASVLTHRRSRSHPIPPSAGSRRAKIPSPRPPSFLPACWRGRFLRVRFRGLVFVDSFTNAP